MAPALPQGLQPSLPTPPCLPSSSQGWQSLEKWVGLLQLPGRNGRFPSGKLVLSIGLWVQSLFRAAEHYMGMTVPEMPWPVHLQKLGRAASCSAHLWSTQGLWECPGRAHAPEPCRCGIGFGQKWPGHAFVGGETKAAAEPQGTPPQSPHSTAWLCPPGPWHQSAQRVSLKKKKHILSKCQPASTANSLVRNTGITWSWIVRTSVQGKC